MLPHECCCLQKGGCGSLQSGWKWNGATACMKAIFRNKWQITLLRCFCGKAKYALGKFIMSSCTSRFFDNTWTYLIIKYTNYGYFEPTSESALFLVGGWIRWAPEVPSSINYSMVGFVLSYHLISFNLQLQLANDKKPFLHKIAAFVLWFNPAGSSPSQSFICSLPSGMEGRTDKKHQRTLGLR